MQFQLGSSWQQQLRQELELPYISELMQFLAEEERAGHLIYPPEALIFNAFLQTPYEEVKVVLLGQDPYHGVGKAEGLCFSVPRGVPLPPSLRNIFLELEMDLGIPPSKEGCLSAWARQGVLLLNATLTVRADSPKSHHGRGWERFTDAVIRCLVRREDPIVFVLWGKSAEDKWEHILQHQTMPHAVLLAAHPSPFSARKGFFGCRHFSKINALLEGWGKAPVNWRV